ncbi:YdhK family protein [Fructobacillus americanaquae]|uniref:YdhK family protein n=1 Tax=Fructobacillus americanaquae TaxID=2940302 RepID=A0ABY5C154_9LACO|nr:YdhK family protein [Fructobacillus americanaquae]USS91860.1 YdhK family protein [Fructobacillus americanaquae]
MQKKTIGWLLALGLVFILGVVLVLGMGKKDKRHTQKMTMSSSQMQMSSSSAMAMSSSMSGMDMDESLPTDLPNANQPKYSVGSKITLEADHMTGMKGAKGTVVAAYAVKLYEVDYQPTNGDKKVSGHKWLTKEDFSDMMDHQVGDMVTLTSTHMAEMKGAKATITKVVNGPAYVVSYQPTNGGKMVMNHKYLVESEIKSR